MSTVTRQRMISLKATLVGSLLISILNTASCTPHPGVIRERHIIHAPINYKIIHHYNIKKVPIYIKKHVHHYKPQEEIFEHSQTSLSDGYDNHINDSEGGYDRYPPNKREEEYDDGGQSDEDNGEYDDYEYE